MTVFLCDCVVDLLGCGTRSTRWPALEMGCDILQVRCGCHHCMENVEKVQELLLMLLLLLHFMRDQPAAALATSQQAGVWTDDRSTFWHESSIA